MASDQKQQTSKLANTEVVVKRQLMRQVKRFSAMMMMMMAKSSDTQPQILLESISMG